jgi:soluble lytic murein transglycosylase
MLLLAVYEGAHRRKRQRLLAGAVALAMGLLAGPGLAETLADLGGDVIINAAKDAQRAKDRLRLASLNTTAQVQQHPLASWVDYWELGLRLQEVSQTEVDAFYARWPGSYVEDRLRNDWLLELGRRRDWANFARDFPRFKMNDDREVTCYALLTEHLAGRDVRERARTTWLAQKDGDDGCQLLASTLFEAKRLSAEDVWLKLRLSAEANRPRAIQGAARLLGKPVEAGVKDLMDNAGRYLARKAAASSRQQDELTTLALIRSAANEPELTADLMDKRWERQLPRELAAWVWAQVGRSAGFRLQPEAADYFDKAFVKLHGSKHAPEWSDDTLAWAARAALRADDGAGRPQLLQRALDAMSESDQQRPVWQYWRARLLLANGNTGAQAESRRLLQGLSSPLSFYGKLAAEVLGLQPSLPAAPAPLTAAEQAQARQHPGLSRALALIAMGLRSEGVREWNFSLRGMGDRDLLAAAQAACEREVWDRCINTSERTRHEIDLNQRFPTPYRKELVAQAREAGLDPAYVYGLIRQESRFVTDARSHVGASGLMQVMPSTARWTAKKVGIPYKPEFLTDRDFNLRIGTSYLKLVLDDFGGSMTMAAAAYNAGPSRPRRWRQGPPLDAAVWAENIPFTETRDYVQRVLSNATIYAKLLGTEKLDLRTRLGRLIGPSSSSTAALPPANTDLP